MGACSSQFILASRLGLAESLFDDEHNENTKAKNFKVCTCELQVLNLIIHFTILSECHLMADCSHKGCRSHPSISSPRKECKKLSYNKKRQGSIYLLFYIQISANLMI